jgi:hypothetical protein
MVDVRYDKSHHAGGTPEARVSARLRNSGSGANPNVTVQKGDGPTRTHTNIHHAGHYVQPGTAARESGGPMEQHRHDVATTQGVGYSPKGERNG